MAGGGAGAFRSLKSSVAVTLGFSAFCFSPLDFLALFAGAAGLEEESARESSTLMDESLSVTSAFLNDGVESETLF